MERADNGPPALLQIHISKGPYGPAHLHPISTSMRRLISTVFSAISIPAAIIPAGLLEAESTDAEWDELYAETEAILDFSEDPLADLDLEPGVLTIWSVSLKAGAGTSDNFLKRPLAADSNYLRTEGDLYLNTLFEHASLTALLFGEYTFYEENTAANSETNAFFHANGSRFSPDWTWGAEVDVFYGDQIYDASLSINGTPVGASLRQFRPELTFFAEWILGRRDALRLEGAVRRATFGDPDDDYWRPSIRAEWRRLWAASLETTTEIRLYGESHDADVARSPTGIALSPGQKLELGGLRVEQALDWNPAQWEAFSADARLGAAFEEERNGFYESNAHYWAGLAARLDLEILKFRLTGRLQHTRYRDRQVAFLDDRPLHQTYKILKLEVKKPLPWNLDLMMRVEWTDFDSRRTNEVFSEKRAEVLLGWTY